MAQTYTSGYGVSVNYGFETTYGTDSSTYPKTFGAGAKVTVTRRNNMERLYGLGSRNATTTVAKKYEPNVSIEFVMANASFFYGILGAKADAGSYTHTYTESNTVPSFSIYNGVELGTTDQISKLFGCKVQTATMTAAVDELVKVRLECPYKTETLESGTPTAQVAETFTPYSFASGLVEWSAGGGTVGSVQSFELTINNSTEGLWGLGSRFKEADVPKVREYNIKMTIAFNDVSAFLTKFLGASGNPATATPAAQANLVLTFTTGTGAGTAGNEKIVITLAEISLDEDTLPYDANEIIKEDVSGWALSGTTVVWSNAVATDPTP